MKLKPSSANLYVQIAELLAAGQRICLGTILQAKGSTPQVPGASAIFNSAGLLAGTLGGGILEGDAEKRALESLKIQSSKLYSFELEADISSPEGAICGGEVLVLLDAIPEKNRQAFEELAQSLRKRRAGLFSTRIVQSPDKIEIKRQWTEGGLDALEQEAGSDSSPAIKADELMGREPQLIFPKLEEQEEEGRQECLFLEPVFPLPRLVIAGAGHIGQALAHLGHRLDFEVTVIDDRSEFANQASLPDADHVEVKDIGEALRAFSISSDTFVVIVTRGHQHDGDALRACIKTDAAYIGMIGSRTKIALMREQFLEKEWATEEEWDRVHAPIGLDIHSKTVEEIAISIAAQLVQVRSRSQR
jgi:xanthine dehydrogenase accessory factor